jgi:hypothetical protein
LASSLVPAARRSVVERTFACLVQYRRPSKDCEQFTIASEAVIHLAMIQLMCAESEILEQTLRAWKRQESRGGQRVQTCADTE